MALIIPDVLIMATRQNSRTGYHANKCFSMSSSVMMDLGSTWTRKDVRAAWKTDWNCISASIVGTGRSFYAKNAYW